MGVSPRGKSSLVVAAAIAEVFLVVDGAASKVSRNKINSFFFLADLLFNIPVSTFTRLRRDLLPSDPRPSPPASISIQQPPVLVLSSSVRRLLFWCWFVDSASTWDPDLSFFSKLRR